MRVGKILETVIIASLVGLLISGSWELIKGPFLELKSGYKALIGASIASAALALAYLASLLPETEQTHFKIPIPIPHFSGSPVVIEQITLTAKAHVPASIMFGVIVAALAISDTLKKLQKTIPPSIANPPQSLFRRFAESPLFLYPALALAYKTFLLEQTSPNFWSGYVVVSSILGGPVYSLLEHDTFSIGRIIAIVALGFLLAAVIALAAFF
jgi:hypothetical protein